MTHRRRRWLRRLAIGIAFATFAAPAAARPDEGGASSKGGATAAAVRPDDRADRFTGIQQTHLAANAVRPDDRADRFTGIQVSQLATNGVRPDDRADRFAVSDGYASATGSSIDAGVSWDDAVTLGVGTLVLVLALGLGLGYVRRPKLAGL